MMQEVPPIVTSLGMFIIDDNEYPSSWKRANDYNIIGGAGPYCIVGSRIVSGEKWAKSISGIIDKGSDFPVEVQNEFDSWGTGIIYRYDATRKTTRGVNIYDENDIRHFKYLSEKKRIEIQDLEQNKKLMQSKCFHLICSIQRCKQLIVDIKKHNPGALFIYEPLPDDCIPSNYDALLDLLPLLDVFTPNLTEGCLLLNQSEPTSIEGIQLVTEKYIQLGAPVCVLRCGPLGCFVQSETVAQHLPPYHKSQAKVVDVTGGGNSFCGGFIMGYYLTKDLVVAGICGNIASGCVIERLGTPKRDGENWNGTATRSRLDTYFDNNKDLAPSKQKIDWL